MTYNKITFTAPHKLSGLPPHSPILVALSGGADSSALLHLLSDYRRDAGCRIFAAHVNHGIRGEEYGFEADRDEEFCRNLCDSLNIELFVKRLDVPTLAKASGRSLETEAREARYSFFAEIMRRLDVQILATAHNADDNIETQIFNICRGCGIDGLIGIPQVRDLDAIEKGIVIRPILNSSKADILEFCRLSGISYVTDSTNLEDDCTRNEIRHKIIPELSRLFPALTRSSLKLSSGADEDSAFITQCARDFIEESNGRLETCKLRKLNISVAKRVLMLSFSAVSDASLEYVHINGLLALLENTKNGSELSLPGKTRARIIDGVLEYHKEDETDETEPIEYSVSLNPGLNEISGTPFAVLITDQPFKMTPCFVEYEKKYSIFASAELHDEKSGSLYAKSRISGASVLDGGINKKIKKLMCDKKIPLLFRNTLPVIYSDNDVIYLPQCAIRDTHKPKKDQKTFHITILYKNDGGNHE